MKRCYIYCVFPSRIYTATERRFHPKPRQPNHGLQGRHVVLTQSIVSMMSCFVSRRVMLGMTAVVRQGDRMRKWDSRTVKDGHLDPNTGRIGSFSVCSVQNLCGSKLVQREPPTTAMNLSPALFRTPTDATGNAIQVFYDVIRARHR